MSFRSKSTWLSPAALLGLSSIPIAAGAVRLVRLASGGPIGPDDARFFVRPAPVVVHIASVAVFCLLGALQFAPRFRERRLDWHRRAGRLVAPCGVIAALSGLWMTQFYPPTPGDGTLLYGIRLLVGSAMLGSLGLGVAAILRRDIAQHRAWMTRGYALGMGAGTQALLHLPWLLLGAKPVALTRALLMGAGWALNIAFAEWRIRRRPAAFAITHQATSA